MTRIEKLAPEITALAASIGQEVHYHGGDYFMVPCQRSLWNTRDFGRLTQDGADTARRALARMVANVLPEQARPVSERIEAVCRLLAEHPWQPRHFLEVTTASQDRGALSRWLGAWTVRIHIAGGPDVEIRDHAGSRGEAIEAAGLEARSHA